MSTLIRSFALIMIISIALILFTNKLTAKQGFSSGDVLSVYNWGDYIDPDLIKKFETETGMKVIFETFDSNEAMLTKISQGGNVYDVTVPSEYAISKMVEEDLLIPLQHELIPNIKNIDERFMDLSFDEKNKYSLPYFWGTVGIVYNHKLLGDKKIRKWNDLWDTQFKNQIFLVDGAREVIGMGLNSLYYSLNETDESKLIEAKEKLDELVPNVKAIIGDEIKMLMANEEAAIGVVWSGDASEILSENENLDYVVPEEGSNVWFDNMVIPKTAKNIEGAHAFINFMLDPENAAQNADYVGYATPNKAAYEIMDDEVITDERFYPSSEQTETLEVYNNLGKEMLAFYNELFLEFKMHRK